MNAVGPLQKTVPIEKMMGLIILVHATLYKKERSIPTSSYHYDQFQFKTSNFRLIAYLNRFCSVNKKIMFYKGYIFTFFDHEYFIKDKCVFRSLLLSFSYRY